MPNGARSAERPAYVVLEQELAVLAIPDRGQPSFLSGGLAWNVPIGMSFLAYGMFVRMVYVMHSTWLISSTAHIED